MLCHCGIMMMYTSKCNYYCLCGHRLSLFHFPHWAYGTYEHSCFTLTPNWKSSLDLPVTRLQHGFGSWIKNNLVTREDGLPSNKTQRHLWVVESHRVCHRWQGWPSSSPWPLFPSCFIFPERVSHRTSCYNWHSKRWQKPADASTRIHFVELGGVTFTQDFY